MKAGNSSLNPFAESYVPLSKRGTFDESKDIKSSRNESKSSNETVKVGPQHWNATTQVPRSYNFDTSYSAGNSKPKGHTAGYPCSSSYNPAEMTEKQIPDGELEMDLAYLQISFPGISDECLSDVYLANKGDLNAAIDMLTHLELPDTLDIGDVPEYGGAGEVASQKQKNLNIEAGASMSGASGTAPPGN